MNQPEKNTAKDIQQEKTGIEEEAAQQREMPQQPRGEAAGGIIKQEAEGGKREKRKKQHGFISCFSREKTARKDPQIFLGCKFKILIPLKMPRVKRRTF